MVTTTQSVALAAHPIPTADLRRLHDTGVDVTGEPAHRWPDPEGAWLRCCLRRASATDAVVLISHAPLREPSPWREVGPVFVHAEPCGGFDPADGLPAQLRTGPRVLRGYRHDGSLDYDAIAEVPAGVDLESSLRDLLSRDGIAEVHVRAAREQCFTYLVRRA